jgi:hypothetical protein
VQCSHGGVAELLSPRFGGVGGGLLCRPGARPATVGQSQYPGPGIGGIGFADDVSALHKLLDELTGSLLGNAQIIGDVHHRGAARADPHESESVRGPDIREAALGQPALDPVNNLRRSAKDEHRNGYATVISHDPSLTDRSSCLTI